MNSDDLLQKNIRRTSGLQALRRIRAIVDEENAHDAFKVRALRYVLAALLAAVCLILPCWIAYRMGVI
ncbi:MAG: hypothetical protein ACOY3V_03010 [Pseudomonadota bacterium]